MDEKKQSSGIKWWPRKETAPEWKKGSVSINPALLIAYLKENREYERNGWFSFDLKEWEGELYLGLDKWKPAVRETFE